MLIKPQAACYMYNVPDWRCIYNTDLFLKVLALLRGHGVRFSDDRYNVDLVAEPLHELDVERLEAVSAGRDEVQAAVHARVGRRRLARHARLRVQKLLVFWFHEVDYRLPTRN